MLTSLLLVSSVFVLRVEASSAEAGQKLHYSYSKEKWLPVEELDSDEILQKLRSYQASHQTPDTRNNAVDDTQYTSEYRDIQAQEKVVLTGVDSSTVTTGVFDVNNIVIHVMQNLVNFLAGTAVWGVLGAMNIAGTNTGRSGRALGAEGILDNFSAGDFSWLLRKIADTSDIISSMHQEL